MSEIKDVGWRPKTTMISLRLRVFSVKLKKIISSIAGFDAFNKIVAVQACDLPAGRQA
ncbi:MAG TPA: hypothetical protein VIH86_05210 [Puia sp.]|jgi:hypothetical protein